MRRRGFTRDLEWLQKFVEIWKRHNIRAKNPIAAKYIPKDYNIEGILGSEGAGTLGCSQFMPATAALHLKGIGEPFDLWDPSTAMRLMALETYRLGWRKDAPAATKIRVLLGWNQHPSWISGIVAGAEKTRLALAAVSTGPLLVAIAAKKATSAGKLGGRIAVNRGGVVWRLPVANPILSSNCQDHTTPTRRSSCAWDLTVPLGTGVYPARAGVVTKANCLNEGNYGCQVVVDHGDGYSTRYAHLVAGTVLAKVGQRVDENTALGGVGWTGLTSFGPHTHFEILVGRGAAAFYGQRIDPMVVFGQPSAISLPYQKFANAKK